MLVALVLLLVGCGAPAPTPAPPSAAVAPVRLEEAPTTVGFADSDLVDLPVNRLHRAVGLMRATGVRSVRILMPWAGVEHTRGHYDWLLLDRVVDAAAASGMSVVATLNSTPQWAAVPGTPPLAGRPTNPADFAAFAGAAAQRYRGRIAAYEVWNEPNAAMFFAPGPDAGQFAALLKAAYPAIKAADPAVTVVSGGLGAIVDHEGVTLDAVKFVDAMYAAGAGGAFDALAYHPYQYRMPFSAAGFHPDAPINQVAGIRAVMLANGDGAKKIWATEYGVPTSEVGEAQQAAMVDDMLTAWRTLPYAGPVYLYTMRDRRTGSVDAEDTFGAFRSDGTPKPVVDVITAHARKTGLAAIRGPR